MHACASTMCLMWLYRGMRDQVVATKEMRWPSEVDPELTYSLRVYVCCGRERGESFYIHYHTPGSTWRVILSGISKHLEAFLRNHLTSTPMGVLLGDYGTFCMPIITCPYTG